MKDFLKTWLQAFVLSLLLLLFLLVLISFMMWDFRLFTDVEQWENILAIARVLLVVTLIFTPAFRALKRDIKSLN